MSRIVRKPVELAKISQIPRKFQSARYLDFSSLLNWICFSSHLLSAISNSPLSRTFFHFPWEFEMHVAADSSPVVSLVSFFPPSHHPLCTPRTRLILIGDTRDDWGRVRCSGAQNWMHCWIFLIATAKASLSLERLNGRRVCSGSPSSLWDWKWILATSSSLLVSLVKDFYCKSLNTKVILIINIFVNTKIASFSLVQ